jgi:hypothetical protein
MATSGTYNFAPAIGTLTITALSRIGIRQTAITQQHMQMAYMEANLLQAQWAADNITWFTVNKTDPITLEAGTATYDVDPEIVSVLDLYITANDQNRLIMPMSRTDYASLANPDQEGFPTTFWWNRALSPTITLWPVPDDETDYTMTYYYYTQMEDAEIRSGGQAAIPYWYYEAYTADLAHRLSRHFAQGLEQARKADRDEAYVVANKQVENSPMYITPGLSGYFRR